MVTVLLRNIDLNLLVVLHALLTEKHVTRTGGAAEFEPAGHQSFPE